MIPFYFLYSDVLILVALLTPRDCPSQGKPIPKDSKRLNLQLCLSCANQPIQSPYPYPNSFIRLSYPAPLFPCSNHPSQGTR